MQELGAMYSMGRTSSGRGQAGGHGGHKGCQARGCGGYSVTPRTVKKGLTAELEAHIFDYAGANAADLMRITQDKIVQYAGAKFGTDIATKLQTKTTITILPPQYSNDIIIRHVDWEKIQCNKQRNVLRVLEAKKADLETKVSSGEDVEMELIVVDSQIDEKKYKLSQPVE
jgi:hypothetical protein